MTEFKVGDKVRHKSGGPEMVVSSVSAAGRLVMARWWIPLREEFAVEEFSVEELDRVSLRGANEVELPKQVEGNTLIWQRPHYLNPLYAYDVQEPR